MFWTDSSSLSSEQHPIDVLHGGSETAKSLDQERPLNEIPSTTTSHNEWKPKTSTPPSTNPTEAPKQKLPVVPLQEQFQQEYEALGLNKTSGAIYGTTLKHLIEGGGHAGFASIALTPSNTSISYSETPLLKYNPYPDYNNKIWNNTNIGTYYACDGPFGKLEDVLVASGHPVIFGEPPVGSYVPLDIDSNLCFERETRLGPYGFLENRGSGEAHEIHSSSDESVWKTTNWGLLQTKCLERNKDRYEPTKDPAKIHLVDNTREAGNTSVTARSAKQPSTDPGLNEEAARKQGLHGMPDASVKRKKKSRTAILIRTDSEQNYTSNDKQNIRSIVAELSLRSGGEYQVWLAVEVKDPDQAFWTDSGAYQNAIRSTVPDEFWNMTILWSSAFLKEKYPLLPAKVGHENTHWLIVQQFSQQHPEFEHVWNWEFDTRYTGQHYNLLEKLSSFAKNQPRKGLWERNARFYIPSLHRHYDSIFRRSVENRYSPEEMVWGPASHPHIIPLGPTQPVPEPTEDKHKWGVGEDADYISLMPIFDPVDTTWSHRNDVWGFDSDIPRRGSLGTHSRISKRLLHVMHQEDLIGNHLGNELAPATIALLHGFKPVFAPMPIFFDRDWAMESLEKFFNPGRLGESGSSENSPFSKAYEGRFEGTTWHSKAAPPTRLYNNWLGKEDSGKGGNEWEKQHGRVCLPPMFLRSIRA